MKNKYHMARLLKTVSLSLLLMLGTVHSSAMELTANKWQLISFPRLPINATIDSVFGDAATGNNRALISVWTFDNNAKQWKSWPEQAGLDSSSLSELTLGQGYWVKTSANITLDLSAATQAVGEMVLYQGWNLIGLSIDQTMGHEQAMAGVPFLELWKYDVNNSGFSSVQKSRGSQIILKEEFTDIDPGTGMWVYMAEQSSMLPSMGTLLPPDMDVEPLLNITEYGVETPWVGFQVGADVDWDGDNQYDFPNTQTMVAFGDFLNRQRMSIVNNGNGVLSWQATISDGDDWLKFEVTDENGQSQYLSELSGSASDVNSALTLFVDRVGKASGRKNNAKITITANGEVPTKIIDVSMDVADIIGDYEVNIDLKTIDNKFADLHNPKYFLSLARDGDGIKAFLDEERSLLIPSTTYLSGSYAGDPASNFQILGQITQSASDSLNPFGKEIRRQITYVGRRSDGLDGLSPLDLKGEYYENIYGVFDDPIQLRGSFIANRLSPIPAKQDETNSSVRDNIILANDTLLVDLDIAERLSITQVISKLEIDHPEPTALHISLISPFPSTLVLHKNTDKSLKNLSYDDADVSVDGLHLLNGQLSNGTWQLKITNSGTSVGELTNWQLDISGAKVYQIAGNVEPGVRLKISGCGITRTVTSSPDGSFVFDGLIPCDYEISVAQLGYEITATTVTVLGCETEAQCQQLNNYVVELTPEQLAELSPRFIPSSNSMKVIASPMQATLSKDPNESIILNGLDVTDYTAMTKTLISRHWQLFKRINTTTAISDDGYLIDVEYPDGKVPYGKNLIAHSEDYTQWNPANSIALEFANVIDPRGGLAAIKTTHDGSGGAGAAIRSSVIGEGYFLVKSGEFVTCSIFAKPDTVDELRIRFADGETYITAEVLKFTTGENVGGVNLQSKSTTLANDWYRVEATTQATLDYSNYLCEFWMAKGGNLNLTTSESVYLYGPQAEVLGADGRLDYFGLNNRFSFWNEPDKWINNPSRTTISIENASNPTGNSSVGRVEQILDGGNADSIHDGSHYPVSVGDNVYIAVVAKSLTNDNSFRLRFADESGFLGSVSINIDTGLRFSGGFGELNQEWRVTDLTDGFKLFESKATIYRDAASLTTQIILENKDQTVTPPSVGSSLLIQSAFSGKASDWPATYTPPKALNEVFASAYIPSGPLHTERSIYNQQNVLVSEGTSGMQSWAYTLGNQQANAGIYYLKLDSAVKNATNADETLSYTTDDIKISFADTSGIHLGNFSVNAAAGSTSLKAMDSATFDINRPSLVDVNPLKDSTNFTSEINPATETNILDNELNDGVIHEPAGNLQNHYRIFVTTGQLFQSGSMYGAERRLDVGIQSQEANK
jgi:subtilisin-like proprotein convertase family protein